jgi:hypothetical protein
MDDIQFLFLLCKFLEHLNLLTCSSYDFRIANNIFEFLDRLKMLSERATQLVNEHHHNKAI